jgi:hypothetical protein
MTRWLRDGLEHSAEPVDVLPPAALDVASRVELVVSAPRGVTSTSQGHARTVFKRALQHENLLVAETTAREIGHVSLVEALELTALIARKAPRRHARVATRWLLRYLEEHPAATIEEAGMVVSCLCALGSPRHDEAARTLRTRLTLGARREIGCP